MTQAELNLLLLLQPLTSNRTTLAANVLKYCPSFVCQALCHGCVPSRSLSLSVTHKNHIQILIPPSQHIYERTWWVFFLLYDTIQRQGVKLIAPNQRSAQHSSITVSGILHPLPRLSEGPLLLYSSINSLFLFTLTIQISLTHRRSSPYPEPCYYLVSRLFRRC